MRYMLFCLFVFFALRENIKAQNTNIGLQYIDHSTGVINNYNTSNINSDFGLRVCSDCSKWHKGIDLNRPGSTDHGDRIITPVTGTIAQIYRKRPANCIFSTLSLKVIFAEKSYDKER